MGNHLGVGISAAAATASTVSLIGDILRDIRVAREEQDLRNKVQRYEQLQDQMMDELAYYEKLAPMLKEARDGAMKVIDGYKNEVLPTWEKGVADLREKLRQSEEHRRADIDAWGKELDKLKKANDAAEQQIKALKLDLAKAQDKISDLQGLNKASMRMAHDLKNEVDNTKKEMGAEIDRKAKSLETYRAWHAANLTFRCALEMQLLRADPENPLLHDQDLRERVRRAGEMAVTLLDEKSGVDPFDMAREAGLTFDVPGRPSGVQVLAELALTEVYMRRLAFLNAEGEETWKVLHKVQIGHGAMTAARDLLRQKEPESALLQAAAVQQVQELAMGEFQRQQQQRRLNPKGPSAAWSAAVAGQQTVRQRAVKDLEYLIEEEEHHAP